MYKSSRKNSEFKVVIAFSIFISVFQIVTAIQSSQLYQCEAKLQVGFFNFHIMCDSAWYLLSAQEPSRMFNFATDPRDAGSLVQSRPIFVFAAFVLSSLMKLIGVGEISFSNVGLDGVSVSYVLGVYLAYMLINFMTIIMILVISLRILNSFQIERKQIIFFLGLVSCITCSTSIMNLYFWLPNPALSNLLVILFPYFVVHQNIQIGNSMSWTTKTFILLTPLYYPNFLFSACFLLFYSLFRKKRSILSLTSLSLLFWFSWPKVVNYSGGTYNDNALSQYSSFTWLIKAHDESRLDQDIGLQIRSVMSTMLTPTLLSLVIVLILFILTKPRIRDFTHLFNVQLLLLCAYLMWLFALGRADLRWTEVLPFSVSILLLIEIARRRALNFKDFVLLSPIIFVSILLNLTNYHAIY